MNMDWHDLIQRYISGTITETETEALEQQLKTDAALRDWYLDALNLDSALESAAESAQTALSLPVPFSQRVLTQASSHRFRWLSWRPLTAAAAVLVLLAVVAAWRMGGSAPGDERAFAVLAAANEAVWADPNVELALRGGELPPGLLRLESGTAEFLCADGATVVMRGPAVMRFAERKRVFVESGRVFFRCPSPESRLSVETVTTEVVDLGTEFAVDARADRSTLVAVLSGEVQVGKTQLRLLRQGESVEVRSDGVMTIPPFAREEFHELLRASPSVNAAVLHGENVLRDPGFETGLSGQPWSGTEGGTEPVRRGGRNGSAVRVFAGGYAPWPLCRQTIASPDIAGKLLVASVWAATPARDKLREGQFAILKIAFFNDQGREFAVSKRHLLTGSSSPDHFEQVQLAAMVPWGTKKVQFQLALTSRGLDSGSVIFDDAALRITDPPLSN